MSNAIDKAVDMGLAQRGFLADLVAEYAQLGVAPTTVQLTAASYFLQLAGCPRGYRPTFQPRTSGVEEVGAAELLATLVAAGDLDMSDAGQYRVVAPLLPEFHNEQLRCRLHRLADRLPLANPRRLMEHAAVHYAWARLCGGAARIAPPLVLAAAGSRFPRLLAGAGDLTRLGAVATNLARLFPLPPA